MKITRSIYKDSVINFMIHMNSRATILKIDFPDIIFEIYRPCSIIVFSIAEITEEIN